MDEYKDILREMDEIIAELKNLPECSMMYRRALRHRNYVQGKIYSQDGDEVDIKKLRKRCEYMRLVIQRVKTPIPPQPK